jgi:Transposase
MPLLDGKVDAVIGVDTHRDSHAAAILNPTGGLLTQLDVPASQAGYQQLLRLACQRAPGRRCWALEGTGCYGAGLASFLLDHGEWVVEIDRPQRPRGRNGAKSDPLDAIRAGREALSRDHLATPRQRGHREALRVLQLTRTGAVKVAADARRHLKALLVTAPEPLRAALRGGTWLRQARVRGAGGHAQRPGGVPRDRAGVAGDRRAGPGRPPGGQGAGGGAAQAGAGGGAQAAGAARGGPGHRGAGADRLVAPGPAALGGGVCDAGRRGADRGIVWPGGAASAHVGSLGGLIAVEVPGCMYARLVSGRRHKFGSEGLAMPGRLARLIASLAPATAPD